MHPRLLRVINTDFLALLGVIGVPLVWVIGAVFPYMRKGAKFDEAFMLGFALPVSACCFALAVWRVWRIYNLFDSGQSVNGRLTDVVLWRDRGRIKFKFEFDGREFRSSMLVHQTDAVLKLQPEQDVDLLVHPAHPRTAIIKQLFV